MGEVKRIDTKFFSETISALRAGIDKYRAAREMVFNANDSLTNSWEGNGKECFEREFLILKTKLTDQEDNLREMALQLEKIALTYEDIDNSVAEQINKE
ncbi:MAG: WXG100 family type VII secretion target [Intestinibacter sp.]